MSDIFDLTNKISPLYEQALIEKGGKFICPVCGKEYKTVKGAEKHFAEKNCYDFADVFGGTTIEDDAFVTLKESGIRFAHRKAFRSSKVYKSSIRYILSCREHKIDLPNVLYSWMKKKVGKDKERMSTMILSKAQDESNIRAYRIWLHNNPQFICPNFAKRYEDDLCEDSNFFIRSLERAHITFGHIFESEKLKEAASNLPFAYAERMEKLYEKVNV